MSKEKRNKFSIEEKEKIVVSILRGTESYSSVARELKTSHRLISLWVDCYKVHGKSGLSMKRGIVHTGEFKLSLLQEMLNNGLSLQQLSVKYLISPSVISIWKRQYENDGLISLFKEKRRGRPPKMKKKPKNKQANPISEKEKLLKENECLHAENDYLKKLHALIQKQKAQKKGW
jgi:transposase